jgi:HAD superfamily hydrolase (TIGR01544 family)
MTSIPTETYYGHEVAFAQKDEFMSKVSRLRSHGLAGLRVVSDFDFTMSKFLVNGKRGASCHKVIEDCGLLPEEYHTLAQALQHKYYPLEVDPTLNMEDKIKFMIEWVDQAHELLAHYGLTKHHIEQAVAEALKTPRLALRERLDEFLHTLKEANVPLLIFSAGIADVLEEVLTMQYNIDCASLHVISNRCLFSTESHRRVIGFEQPLLHVFNKRSDAYLHTAFFKEPGIEQRRCLLLLGDSLGDVSMSEGMGIEAANVLRVGFLNDRVERLPQYLECYDLVILGDPGFDLPLQIVRDIAGAET